MFYTSGKHRSGNLLNDFLRSSPGIYFPKEITKQGVTVKKASSRTRIVTEGEGIEKVGSRLK